jgi:hypothetical protein
MSRSQREKGKRGERETAHDLEAVFGPGTCRRGLKQCRDGCEEPDVVVPEEAMLWVENKCGAKPNVRAALAQARAAAPATARVLVVIRDDRQTPFIAMPLPDAVPILRQWWELSLVEAHLRAAMDEAMGDNEKRIEGLVRLAARSAP